MCEFPNVTMLRRRPVPDDHVVCEWTSCYGVYCVVAETVVLLQMLY